MNKLMILLLFVANATIAQTSADNTNWFTDFEKAKAFAAENDGQILMVFSGSDWCKPCIKFKKDILVSSIFSNYANEKIAILYLDFPAKRKNKLSKEQTKHNEALAEKYNQQGFFPNVVLMDSQAKVLATPQFKGQTPSTYVAQLNEIITE